MQTIWERVDQSAGPNGCWFWNGPHNQSGTPIIHYASTSRSARQTLYEITYHVQLPVGMKLMATCKDRGCINPAHAEPAAPPHVRFWQKVNATGALDDCWPWIGLCDEDGYGQFNIGNGHVRAHRYAFFQTYPEADQTLHVLHSCDNRPCCNPGHLWQGTNLENQQDKWNKGRGSTAHLRTGRLNPSAGLTMAQAEEARRLHREQGLGTTHIGRILNAHPTTIRGILDGKLYKPGTRDKDR